MYELLHGEPPFFSDDINMLYQNIKQGQINFNQEVQLQNSTKDLIRSLMSLNVKNRIGSVNGLDEIKAHSFYQDFDWEKLHKKQLKSVIKLE